MKIVNLETFRSLPANTLFAKYEPCQFTELEIKGETLGNDFLATSDLSSAIECSSGEDFAERLERARKTGESLSMDFDSECRDGCYDPEQLFAVWEAADVRTLIARLNLCLPSEKQPCYAARS